MKKRNWVIMMSAAALAMASVTGCSSQNGGETTAKRKMQVEVKMGLLLMG